MLDAVRFSISATNMAGNALAAVRTQLGDVRGALATVQDQARRTGASMRQIGQGASLRITAPVVAGLGAVVTSAGSFEASMNRVRAVTSGTSEDFDALGILARDLGASTKFSASEAADAMGFLGMASFDAQQVLGAMPSTLQLAAAAGADLATSADIVSNILSGFGREVGDLAEVNDVLVATLSASNVDLRMMGDAMKYVAPFARSAGLRFNEVSAALGMLGNAGIQGEMGGTALAGVIARLSKPTAEVTETLNRLGVSVKDGEGRLKSLTDIIAALEPHAEDTEAILTLFGRRAGPGMSALISQGSDALRQFESDLDGAGGTAARIATVQMQGFNGALTSLRSALEGLAIAVADSGLLNFMTGITERATELVRGLSETNPQILRMGVVAAGAAAAVGPLLIAGGLMVTALAPLAGVVAAVISPLGLLAVGATAAATALYTNWDSVEQRFPALAGVIVDTLGGMKTGFDALLSAAQVLGEGLGTALMAGVGALEALLTGNFSGALRGALDMVNGFADAAWRAFATWLDVMGIQTVLNEAWAVIDGALTQWPARFLEVGGQMMEGLKQGLLDKLASVRDTVTGLGSGLVTSLKDRLGIQSPSRVMRGLGQFVSEGLALGIRDGSTNVVDAMSGVGDEVQRAADRAGQVQGAFKGFFSSIISGSQTASEALAGLLQQAASRHLNSALDSLLGGLGGTFMGGVASFLGFKDGAAFAQGSVVPFATGGVVSGPTMFPMTGGRTGLMGEAGPEAIMPLTRIGGSLGVRAELPAASSQVGGLIRLEIASADGVTVRDVRMIAGEVALDVTRTGLTSYDRARPGRDRDLQVRGV